MLKIKDIKTPCGIAEVPQWINEKYSKMSDEELQKLVNKKPFLDPFAFNEQEYRRKNKLFIKADLVEKIKE